MEKNGRDANAGPDNVKPEIIWMRDGKLSAVMGEAERPSLHGVWLRPEHTDGEWMMWATDSYVMCWKKLVITNDGPLRERAAHPSQKGAIFVPPRAIMELEKSRRLTSAQFEEDGSVTVGDVTFHLPHPSLFLTIADIEGRREALEGLPDQPTPIPAPSKFAETKREKEFKVGLDTKYLGNAAKAFGTTRLVFTLDAKSPLAPVGIRPQGIVEGGSEGLVMPMRLNV